MYFRWKRNTNHKHFSFSSLQNMGIYKKIGFHGYFTHCAFVKTPSHFILLTLEHCAVAQGQLPPSNASTRLVMWPGFQLLTNPFHSFGDVFFLSAKEPESIKTFLEGAWESYKYALNSHIVKSQVLTCLIQKHMQALSDCL